jgi:GMP synthase PP-ATPase subunit
VIGAVSGGVDSTVAAKLMSLAIGERFHAILVDNGVMRMNECSTVQRTLSSHLRINLTLVDASELFLGRLKGVIRIIKCTNYRLLILKKREKLSGIRLSRFLNQKQHALKLPKNN